jgi:hypothetical protein
MERLRADWQKVSREVEELTLKRDSLCGVVEVRQKQAEEDGKAHDGLLTVPNCLKRDWKGRSSLGPDDEGDALEQLRKYLESRNFFFSGRRLYSFHTALKSARTSPLTILAGVSGTGKSLLAKNYADALGMHFLSLAVQPRWDGPQDLFGFYNYLEKRYVPTELAQAMVHMDFFNAERNGIPDSAKKFRDRILLVLLDEMNLARVEYYFSDFLSKLEVRREIENPEKFEQRQAAEVLLGEGVQGDGKRLFPGKNVLFVGTMNEDDSTQTPSPKVVDRSNVLSFERPENFRETQEQWHPMAMPENYLSFETWKSWCHGSKELPGGALEKIRSGLQEINNALAGIGRPFAHRVYNAIVEYIANYPGALEHGDAGRQRRGWAFSDQVEMRLLPKLRGVELSDCAVEVALDVVRSVLEEGTWKDDALLQSFDAASDKNRQGQFIWQGVHRDE